MALYKAWCKLTKKFEFTSVNTSGLTSDQIQSAVKNNILKRLKFEQKLFHIKDDDILTAYEHKTLDCYRLEFYNKGASDTVFNCYVVAKSESQARFYLNKNSVLYRVITWCYGKDSIKNIKALYPEESFEEGSVIFI